MVAMLFIGGPWHGRTEEIPDDRRDWVVAMPKGARYHYTLQKEAAMFDGDPDQRYVREFMIHAPAYGPRGDEMLRTFLLGEWVKAGGRKLGAVRPELRE